jgi:hypothetical protein
VYYRETKKKEMNRDVIYDKSIKGRSKKHKRDSLYSMTIAMNCTVFVNLSQEDQLIFVLKLLMTLGNWYYKWPGDRKELRQYITVYEAVKQALRERASSNRYQQIKSKFEPVENFVQTIEKESYNSYYERREHHGYSLWLYRIPALSDGKIFVY